MKKLLAGCLFVVLLSSTAIIAQRMMEKLDRGLALVPASDGKAFVSWRSLLEDDAHLGFNIYKKTDNSKPMKINDKPIVDISSFIDEGFDSTKQQSYFLKSILKGKESAAGKTFVLPAFAKPYYSIKLQTPTGYTPNDGSIGDLDGDGVFEVIIHQAGRGRDNSQAGITDPPIIQAYKTDGTLLWSIHLGKNIRKGAPL